MLDCDESPVFLACDPGCTVGPDSGLMAGRTGSGIFHLMRVITLPQSLGHSAPIFVGSRWNADKGFLHGKVRDAHFDVLSPGRPYIEMFAGNLGE